MPNFSADDFTKIKERLDQIRKDEPIQSPVTTPENVTTQAPSPSPDAGNADYYGCGLEDNSTYTQEQAMEAILDNYKRQAEKHLSERSIGLAKVQGIFAETVIEAFKEFRMRDIVPDYSLHDVSVND